MIAAVFDTNVLASGFIRNSSPPGQLLAAWSTGAFELVVSEPILTELAHTFEDPYFLQRRTAEQMAADIALLSQQATITSITVEVHGVATHPEDDLILATAVSFHADYLVTGDSQLQKLGAYQGVTILSPRAFLDLILANDTKGEET